jgi:hypothetical protein
MIRDRLRELVRLIDADTYGFLRVSTSATLRAVGSSLQLRPAQMQALATLHDLARRVSRAEFDGTRGVPNAHVASDDPLFACAVVRESDQATSRARARARFADLLRGKRVVLVGPAQSIVGSTQGAAIEAFDLVVRLNAQWPVPAERVSDCGSRMDVLYHCCNGDAPVSALFTPAFASTRFVCWLENRESVLLETRCRVEGVPSLNVSDVAEILAARIGTVPHTGLLAIEHLLDQPIAELYITGMTFFHGPYYAGYRAHGPAEMGRGGGPPPAQVGIHAVAPQLDAFRDRVRRDPRVRLDEALNAIVGG